jgi:preprotein translocase subunit SecF
MTRVIGFDRSFKITVPISVVIIIAGIFGAAFLGFNNGVDFQAGLNTSIQFAPPSMRVAFTGEGTMRLSVTKADVELISQAPSGQSKAYLFAYDKYPTLQAMGDALKTAPGVQVEMVAKGDLASNLILGASQTDSTLSPTPTVLHVRAQDASTLMIPVESLRNTMKGFGNVSIQRAGDVGNREFVIRVEDSGKDPTFATTIHQRLVATLGQAYGADNVLVNSSSFVGARFSKNLADQAVWMTLMTFLVILVYCSFRFKLNYAIGAVLSVVHDALVLVAFIVFTRMEFNTAIIAAILTIVGYSINDTIVIYDRIREKVKLNPTAHFRENMNRGVTETLGRTFITSGTVLLSAIALYIFTTGSMKDFSLCIIVGVITGTYSSVFIASAFVDMWNTFEEKALKKKQELSASAAAAAKAALDATKSNKGNRKALES